MKEQIISFQTAKLAKEKGLKIGSRRSYTEYKDSYDYDGDPNHHESYKKGDIALDYNFYMVNNESELGDISNKSYNLYEAPTQSLLQKWLREVHNIDVVISPERYKDGINYLVQAQKWDLTSNEELNPNFVVKGSYWFNDNHEYPTYEEAFEKGLQEALKLLP